MNEIRMSSKSVYLIFLTICGMAFVYALYRDIRSQDHCSGSDLRNRVVGARIIKDGHSPYFYKWKESDGARYYDHDNYDPDHCESGSLSTITATPFFHHLLYPIAEWPQSLIFRVWLVIQYLLWIGIVVFFFRLARTPVQQYAVLTIAILFLFTEAWTITIFYGQYYLFVPFFAMLFYWLVKNRKNELMAAAAGLVAITLVLVRPNALLFFLPFLLLYKTYPRNYLIVLAIPILFLTGWTVLDKTEIGLWKDYSAAIKGHIAAHQALQPFIHSAPFWPLRQWEGIDADKMTDPGPKEGENEEGNFFLLVKRYYRPGLGLVPLQILTVCLILGVLGVFYLRHRAKEAFSPPQVAMLGYALYMISDLFSPITRWQYYTVQWIFPLLLAAAVYDRRDKWAFLLLLAGLGLNVININRINIEHSIGEYLMLAALISLSFIRKPAKNGLSAV
jgi:hypothetical protein